VTSPPAQTMVPSGRRRQVVLGVLRSLAASVVLVAVYYVLPLDHLAGVPLAVILIVGVAVLLAVAAWQLRLVLRARYPGLRAGEALATTVPLFLLCSPLSTSSWPGRARRASATISPGPIRLISPSPPSAPSGTGTSPPPARLIVTAQMVLDLLALSLGIRVFIGAVQLARQAQAAPAAPAPPPDQVTAPTRIKDES
jgi:voltage-gated potassium channel